MSCINEEEASSSQDSRTLARDTKLTVATDRDEGGCHCGCFRQGDKEDAVAMAVVTAASKNPSRKDQSHGGSINPLLHMSACQGHWAALNVFLEEQDNKIEPRMIITQELRDLIAEAKVAASPVRAVEEGSDHQPASDAAGVLLKGTTPDGDTALHVVANKGDADNFLKYASIIYCRESGLLFAKNHMGDTPLHCAARAGNIKMASHLIDLAGHEGPGRKLMLLRMENKRHETALHEAVRFEQGRILGLKDREALFGADGTREEKIRAVVNQQEERTVVKLLMGVDPQLANYPADGVSPLYLAILLEKSTIALTLYEKSNGDLSYSGADGQNALHLAVLRDADTVIVELLLDWDNSLTVQVDKDGNTPLHFGSSIFFSTGSYLHFQFLPRPPWCRFVWFPWRPTRTLEIVYRGNPSVLYLADKKGLFPIHVAASVGAVGIVQSFLRECPDSAGFRDAKGRTFLHVAIEKQITGLVSSVCGDPSLAWIVNLQDNDGNTALHLAIEAGSFRVFCALLGHEKVNLNIPNNQGETPRDISLSKMPRGLGYSGNCENRMYDALRSLRANHGALRWDNAEEKYCRLPNPEEEDKESVRLKEATQTLVVTSVLIATMAFNATFAFPGGYRADEHTNGGTPTLAGRYIFDAFIMASALAFICSALATAGFMFAGLHMVNLHTRQMYLIKSVRFMSSAITSLCIAFALGVYMVLAPVSPKTAIAVCVMTTAVFLTTYKEVFGGVVMLVRPLHIRKGLFRGMVNLLRWNIFIMVTAIWPFIVTFGWAELARIHRSR